MVDGHSSPGQQDAALLIAWKGGDRDAGAKLIRRCSGPLVRFFRTKLNGPVDDLVQQTFLTCVEHREAVRTPAKFRSYLLSVARRKLIEHYASSDRQRRRFDPLTTSAYDIDPTPSRAAADRQQRWILIEGLRRVPLTYQIALELYYWQRYSASEIAEVLEIPEGTVRSRIRRGLELLRETMGELTAQHGADLASADALEEWADGIRNADRDDSSAPGS